MKGDHLGMNTAFGRVRDELNQSVNTHPEDAKQLGTLAVLDAALGRKELAIEEAKHAVRMLPIFKDATDGPFLVDFLAIVYAWTNEPDLAFQQLAISIRTPGGVSYGDLKLNPAWDPLRTDPRFEKLLAQLAPDQRLEKPPFGCFACHNSQARGKIGTEKDFHSQIARHWK